MVIGKKSKLVVIFVIVLIFIAILLAFIKYFLSFAPLLSSRNSNTSISSSYHYALVFRGLDDNYIRRLKQGADAVAAKSNILMQYENLENMPVKEQIEVINSLIYSKVSGIITTGCDSDQLASVINKAIEKGIPVITIRADSLTSYRNASIGTNYFSAGVEAAKSIEDKLQQGVNIGVITGEIDMLSVMGFKSIVDRFHNSKIKMILSGELGILQVSDQIRDMLYQHPEINVIFVAGVMETSLVTRAIINFNKVDSISIVGFGDATETIRYLKKGIIVASIVESPYDVGSLSVKTMTGIMHQDKVSWTLYTEIKVITPANVNDYESENLLQNEKDINK